MRLTRPTFCTPNFDRSPSSANRRSTLLRNERITVNVAWSLTVCQVTPYKSVAPPLRVDERTGIFQIACRDRVGGPIGQRRDRAGRVVAGVLRKCRAAHHEQIAGFPVLQI